MKFLTLTILIAFCMSGGASAQALLVWSGETKVCGTAGFGARTGHSIEHFEHSDEKIIRERRKVLEAENKQAGGGWFWSDIVPKGSCVAVAKADKKINGCAFESTVWRIAKGREEAVAAIEHMPANDTNIKTVTVQQVECAAPDIRFRNKDTAWAVRG